MEKLDISLHDVLEEYNKCFISKLINKDYDFAILRNKVKEFSKSSDIFNYNDFQTDDVILSNVKKYIENTSSKEDLEI